MTFPRIWIAWLLALVFGLAAPAQAMRGLTGLETPLGAKSHCVNNPINFSDPSGLDASVLVTQAPKIIHVRVSPQQILVAALLQVSYPYIKDYIRRSELPPGTVAPGTNITPTQGAMGGDISSNQDSHNTNYPFDIRNVVGPKPSTDGGSSRKPPRWSNRIGQIANKFRMTRDEVDHAIHICKGGDKTVGGNRRNPDTEVDLNSGDVRYQGETEPFGNIIDGTNYGTR